MTFREVCHFWPIVSLDPFLRFWPMFRPGLVRLLIGVLTHFVQEIGLNFFISNKKKKITQITIANCIKIWSKSSFDDDVEV